MYYIWSGTKRLGSIGTALRPNRVQRSGWTQWEGAAGTLSIKQVITGAAGTSASIVNEGISKMLACYYNTRGDKGERHDRTAGS